MKSSSINLNLDIDLSELKKVGATCRDLQEQTARTFKLAFLHNSALAQLRALNQQLAKTRQEEERQQRWASDPMGINHWLKLRVGSALLDWSCQAQALADWLMDLHDRVSTR